MSWGFWTLTLGSGILINFHLPVLEIPYFDERAKITERDMPHFRKKAEGIVLLQSTELCQKKHWLNQHLGKIEVRMPEWKRMWGVFFWTKKLRTSMRLPLIRKCQLFFLVVFVVSTGSKRFMKHWISQGQQISHTSRRAALVIKADAASR